MRKKPIEWVNLRAFSRLPGWPLAMRTELNLGYLCVCGLKELLQGTLRG